MKPRFNSLVIAASPIFLALSMGTARAAPLYWDISAANNLTAGAGTWGTDAFWATSSAPLLVAPGAWTDGSDAFFQTGGTNTVAIAAAGVSANSVTQTTNTTATTINNTGGGTLSITGTGGIVNTGNTTFTINAPVNLNGAATYTFQSNSTITMGGAIGETGTAGILKTGNSVLNLNAANSFSGGITINAGRISVGASGSLGSNVVGNSVTVAAGANLALAAAANIGASQIVSISSSASALGGIGVGYAGSLPTLDTTGTGSDGGVFGINFTGTAGFSSLATLDTTLNAFGGTGHWYLGSQSTGTFDGATLAAASDSIYRLGGGGGTLTFNQPNVITGANDLQVGASVTGGGGTVVLGAAQNHTGSTTVSGGTLKLGNAGALGDLTTHTTGLTVNGSGIFDFAGFAPTYSTLPIILNSTANGFDVGAFTNSGASAVTFGGTIELQRQTRIGGAQGIILTGKITGGGFNLIKDSVSTLTLSNSETVALGALQSNRGTIQVDPGTTLNVTSIDIGIGNSVGAGLTLNGGSVTSSGTSRFGQGSGTASGTLTLNSGTLTVPALTKGTLTFTANFNGGTLKARSASSNFLTATTANVRDGGAIIDSNSFDITVAQPLLRFAGATTDKLTKNGNGFLTLSGTNTYGGGTDVNSGGLTYLNTNAKPSLGTTTVASAATLGLGVATSGAFFTSGDVDSLFAGTLAGVTNSATSNVGIDTAAASFTYSSSIPANTKGLVKLGANTLTLNGTNAYTGGTSVNGGTLILLGDQSAATGGISGTSTVQTTISIGSAAQTSVTTAAVASGKTVSFGNSGGFVFQYLNVSGSSGFPTTVTNNGSMSLGRFGEVNINAYGNWIQNGDLTIQPNGGTYADFLLKANGTVTYGGVNPINITTSLGGSGNAWLSIAGTFTTSQGFNLNSNTVATYYPYMILTGGTGTLKLSANVAQLVNTTGTGGITGNLQLGTGGGTIDTNGFSTAIGANIVNVAAQTGSLTKAGSGTLTLSGTNDYTGTTTVAAGTLEVTGSLGATAVTVQNNATLAGNGNLGGNVTIQTGGHHALAVAATTGAQVTRTITGALDLTAVGNILDLAAASTPAPGGPYVLVTATGGITGAPTTVNLSGLAGTVAVNGNNLELTVTAPPAGYTSWIDGFGLAAADKDPLDDPDNDGMANALEYVLNANPSVSDPSKLPTLSVTATDFVFSFTRRVESATDTTQVFQYGTNLSGWTPLNITAPTASQVALGTPSGGLQSVMVTIPKTLASGGKLFGRLQVVE